MSDPSTRIAFGNTVITLAKSRPLSRVSMGMLIPTNARGVMAAGLAGEVRVKAGRDVEEELLAYRPLSLGRAYRTGAGRLDSLGVTTLAYAVTSREPGGPAQPVQSERGFRAALELLDDCGLRSVTLPIVGMAREGAAPADQGRSYGIVLTGHLRRRSRLREVTIAGLDDDFLGSLGLFLREAGAIPLDDS